MQSPVGYAQKILALRWIFKEQDQIATRPYLILMIIKTAQNFRNHKTISFTVAAGETHIIVIFISIFALIQPTE